MNSFPYKTQNDNGKENVKTSLTYKELADCANVKTQKKTPGICLSSKRNITVYSARSVSKLFNKQFI